MDKSQFLRNLRASKVKVHAVQIDGWDGLIYLRPQTLGEIRDELMKAGTGKDSVADAKEEVKKDPLFIARNIASVVRDENGVLLFDETDDRAMSELMEALADAAPAISKQINKAYNSLNEPSNAEVAPTGN